VRRLLVIFAILFTLSAYIYQVIPFCLDHSVTCFAGIGQPTSKPVAPGAYRLLLPELETLAGYDNTKAGLILTGMKIHGLLIPLIFITFYQWGKRWRVDTIPAVFALGMMFSLAFQFYLYDPGSLIEMLLVLLLLLFHKRFGLCLLIVAIAALNRETAFFLPFVYYALDTSRFRRAVALMAVFGVIFAGIRLIVGPAEHMLGNVITGTLAYNLGTLSDGLVVNVVLLPLWIVVAMNYRHSPKVLQHLAWIASAYGIAIAVGAAWDEASRLVMPIIPLLLPIIFGKSAWQETPLMQDNMQT